jgi:mutator protein MutT
MKQGIDYIGVGVGAVIFNDEGKVFLAKRGKEARNESGKWEFPGGGVEFGDTFKDTIIREMKEEFGITIEVGKLLGVSDHIIIDEKQHWVSPAYICKIAEGVPEIQEPHKIDAIGWFELAELEKLSLSLVTQSDVKSLKEQYPEKFSHEKRN